MSLLFKNYSRAEVTYLIIFKKTLSPSRETQNTDRNCVNEQKTDTPHTKRKMTIGLHSVKISDTSLFSETPLFYQPVNYAAEQINGLVSI